MGGYISRFWMMASFRDKLTLQALEGMKITSFTATDVALQMLLDGCQVTKLQNHETTPLIFINLNLTPQRRYRNENILLSCLIPGPRAHKNLDSFLFPVVQELKELGQGIPDCANESSETTFTLHAYLMLISADGLASADAIGMKKPGNSYRPCHQCSIMATLGLNRTYYIPHSPNMDLHNLSPRQNLRKVFSLWEALADPKRKKEMSQELGLVKSSILMELPTLHFPRSFPLDLMHCVLQNIMPELFRLWGGKRSREDKKARSNEREYRKRLQRDFGNTIELPAQPDLTPQPYELSDKKWQEIGKWQTASRRTIPTNLGQAPRPIDKNYGGYKAMEWQEFLVRDGPALLSHLATTRDGDDTEFTPFYLNFLLLRKIYVQASHWKVTPLDLEILQDDCVAFVRDWEKLYYNNEPERMTVCKINVHALLHLGTSFPTELQLADYS